MKLLFSHYRHLTEVVFPVLAIKYGWDTCNEKDIKVRICNALNIHVPIHPSRHYSTTPEMKRLVTFCFDIQDNPLIFLFI